METIKKIREENGRIQQKKSHGFEHSERRKFRNASKFEKFPCFEKIARFWHFENQQFFDNGHHFEKYKNKKRIQLTNLKAFEKMNK